MKNYIYGLIDPRDGAVRYVGKSYNPDKRLSWGHMTPSSLERNTKKNAWIKKLIRLGLSPEVIILEECGENWEEREKFWITQFENLTNGTEGGVGSKGHTQPEANKKKQSERTTMFWTGRAHTEESKAKMAEAKRGRKLPDEVRSKMSETQKSLPHTYTAKSYIVTFPDGHEETIFNLSQFCREYNLQRQVMDSVVKGKQASHRGFKARPYKEEVN